MKLKLTYQPEEAREADLILRFARGLLPGSKVRRDKSREPKQMAVYVAADRPANRCNSKENT